MNEKYLLAKTFKKQGSVAITLEKLPDFLSDMAEWEALFKRKVELLIVSCNNGEDLDEAWPEYSPVLLVADKKSFQAGVEEKIAGKEGRK